MAVFHGTLRSQHLAMDTNLSVILPYDRPGEAQEMPCKVLYLLHGLGDNHAAWTRYTRIESYARDYGIAVVMPEVQRSFYSDMAYGLSYFSYIAEELPALCSQMFHIGTRREDTFVAGLSMGGYGALKCGLSFPGRYAGCASFSGLCSLAYVLEHANSEALQAQLVGLLGAGQEIPDTLDLFHLAQQVRGLPAGQRPAVFFTCGKQDLLYPQNLAFRDHLAQLGVPHIFRDWEGDHEWGFWDTSVKMALDLFLGEGSAV